MHDAPTQPRAMLMVMMEPPSDLEDEFNDWYDTEHFPQRRSLPGCIAASRWVCVHGWPRWMALYDLVSVDVLRSDAYRSMSGRQSTPWTRRILSRTVGRRRVVATTLAESTAIQHAGWETSRLVVMGIPVETHSDALNLADGLQRQLASSNEVLQLRGFFESRVQPTHDGPYRSAVPEGIAWFISALAAPVEHALLDATRESTAGHSLMVFNVYMPYLRDSGLSADP
ncbi:MULTISPECIES: hypothetical protein [unclassified Burkholderia]|uniref:hypothetical protein n=1 Tax=unclassified Burkholderia TaxID=2613784 RepID=UPI00141FBCE1|nr:MULTISPECIES: hypothetical protein [unclassified Burkholderia]NIE60128.1 hypothetical protein [Burkholderia sp. Ap-955]NIF12132.1 hypothetical protein [Burkholderia sp. Ax-1735]NIG05552.1 hypothetical protein [Burkholderia sp. Tr-849]